MCQGNSGNTISTRQTFDGFVVYLGDYYTTRKQLRAYESGPLGYYQGNTKPQTLINIVDLHINIFNK